MKVLVGGINQEANTFSTVTVSYGQFTRYYGTRIKEYLEQIQQIEKKGIEVIPAVYATTMPSAALEAAEFEKFMIDFFGSYDTTVKIDAIYLCLHGGMYVNDIGSAELYFVNELRKRYGKDISIFASFDFHGNMSCELAKKLNYITAYKTAPHTDELETGKRAVEALIYCLETKKVPHCRFISIPMAFPGERVITAQYPCNHIMPRLKNLEEEEKALDISLFCGFIWSECEMISMGISVSYFTYTENLKMKVCKEAQYIWNLRQAFQYAVEAYEPVEAIEKAILHTKKNNLVFLSDSGDNVTAGAAGDNAYMASMLYKMNVSNSLIAGLADANAVKICYQKKVGDIVELSLGGSLDTQSMTWKCCAKILRKGELIPNRTVEPVNYVLVQIGEMEVLINEVRYEFTEIKHFRSAGISLENYRVICIKLGYLYPELESIAKHSILALTTGNADQVFERICYKEKRELVYPEGGVVFMADGELAKS